MANLARGVSHDLKNAMGSILPTVQQLCAEAASGTLNLKTLHEDLQQMERAVQVCRRIFQGMLSSARREAGAAPCGNLRHAIDGTLAVLEEGMRRRSIAVTQSLCDPIPSLLVPQSDLEQLLLNVLTNARDAMPEGGSLSISAQPRDGALCVCVEDTGCGIDPEHLPRVMDLFYTTKSDGTGMGLAHCHSIVDEARGRIEIESRPGSGTRVSFTLPVET
jgi:signal transduction histidine kinase